MEQQGWCHRWYLGKAQTWHQSAGIQSHWFLLTYSQSDYVQPSQLKLTRLLSGNFLHIPCLPLRKALLVGRGKHLGKSVLDPIHSWHFASSTTMDKCNPAFHGVIALHNLDKTLGFSLSSEVASKKPHQR